MKNIFKIGLIVGICAACIGTDIIDDEIPEAFRVLNPIERLEVGEQFQLEVLFLNNVGVEEELDVAFSSSDPAIASIDAMGEITAIEAGETTITAIPADRPELTRDFLLQVQAEMIDTMTMDTMTTDTMVNDPLKSRSGVIETTTFYVLEGDFTLTENGEGGLILEVFDNYRASSSLPGLYVYLTNNPLTVANALEISEVTVFNGAHSFEIPDVGINDYSHLLYFCKPFNVKVGDGEILEE